MTKFHHSPSAKSPYFTYRLYPIAIIAAGTLFMPLTSAYAAPSGGKVTSGNASISQTGNITEINQASNTASLDWQSFNVNANETVNFVQPSASAVAINRIYDQNTSEIYGSINANGRVFLQNPNGFIFGRNSVINVNSIIATTLNIADEGNGRYVLAADNGANGQIINRGLIQAATGGSVNLIANSVDNQGAIIADYGHINLASGRQATIDFDGDGLLSFAVDAATINNDQLIKDAIKNSGSLQANGGTIALTAKTAQGVFDQAINNEGLIEAGRIANIGGEIHLIGSGAPVVQSGELRAAGSNGDGGFIHLKSDNMTIASNDSVTDVSSETGTGGLVKFLGKLVGLFGNSAVNASGETGGGEILIGGAFQGKNPDTQNAEKTIVAENVSLKANARQQGNGGEVIVWSDIFTQYYGSIQAKGGSQSGNGGFVEVSGKQTLTTRGGIDTSAAMGESGTILFDPLNIEIKTSGNTPTALTTSNDINTLAFNTAPTDNSVVLASDLANLNGKIILQAYNNINVNADVTLGSGATEFNLQAGENINVNAKITATNSAGTAIHLEADSPHSTTNGANGSGSITFGTTVDNTNTVLTTGEINSNGGDITFIAANFDLANAIKIDAAGGNLNIALSKHNIDTAILSISESDNSSNLTQSDLMKFQNVNIFTIGTATTRGGNGDGTGGGPTAPKTLKTYAVNLNGSLNFSSVANTLVFATDVTLQGSTSLSANNIQIVSGTTLDATNKNFTIDAAGEIDIASNTSNLDSLNIARGTVTADTMTMINAVDTLSLGSTGDVTLFGALDRRNNTSTNLANTLTIQNAMNTDYENASFGDTTLTSDTRINAKDITFNNTKMLNAANKALTLNGSGNIGITTTAVNNLTNLTFAQGNADANTRALLNKVVTLTLGEGNNTLTLNGILDRTATTRTTLNGNLNLGNNTLTSGGQFNTNGKNITAGGLVIADGTFTSATTGGNWDINGAVAISNNATLNATTGIFTVEGNWTNSGSFGSQNGKIDFDGISTSQKITSGGNNFNNLDALNSIELQDATTINGILTIDTGQTFDLSGQQLTLGTLNNSGILQLNGNETLNITTMDTNSGTVKYVGDGSSGNNTFTINDFGTNDYYNLIIEGASDETFQLAQNLTVNNALTVQANNTLALAGNNLSQNSFNNNGTLQLQGTETVSSMDTDSGTVKYVGNGGNSTFTIKDFGGTDYNNLVLASTSNETFQLSSALSTSNLDISTGTLSLNGHALTLTGTTFSNNGTLQLQGNENLIGFTMDTNSGTVKYVGNGGNSTFTIQDFGATDYNNLVLAGTSDETFQLAQNFRINGALTIQINNTLALAGNNLRHKGFNNYGTLQLQGTENISGGMDSDSGTVKYVGNRGSSTFTIKDFGSNDYYNLIIEGASDEIFQLSNALALKGDWTNNNGIFNANGQTVTFNGSGPQNITSRGNSFSNININNTGNVVTLMDSLVLTKNLLISQGTLNTGANYSISLAGNWTNNGGIFTANNGAVSFNGSDAQSITSNGNSFSNININKTGGAVTLNDNLVLTQDLLISQGRLVAGVDRSISLAGNWTNSGGTFNANSGTVNFNGSGSQNITSGGSQFYNLSTSGASAISLSDALTVGNILSNTAGIFNGNAVALNTRNFTLSGGTFNSTSNTMTVTGDWTNSGTGSFNANNGTVLFSGVNTQTISGNNTFNLVSIDKSGNATIRFLDDLTSNALTTNNNSYAISLLGSNNSIGGTTLFQNSGMLTLGSTPGLTTFAAGMARTTSATTVNGPISSGTGKFSFGGSLLGNNIDLRGDLLLNQDLTLSSDNDISITGNVLSNNASSLSIDGTTGNSFSITGDIGKNIDGEKIGSLIISNSVTTANINNIYASDRIDIAATSINLASNVTHISATNAIKLSAINAGITGATLDLQSNSITHKNIVGVSKLKLDTPDYVQQAGTQISVEELSFANSAGGIYLQDATSNSANDLNIGNAQLQAFNVSSKYIFESSSGNIAFNNASALAGKTVEISNGGALNFEGDNSFLALTANSNSINVLNTAKVTTTGSMTLKATGTISVEGALETTGANSTLSLSGAKITFGSVTDGNLASAITAGGNLALSTTSGFDLNGDTAISAASDIDLSGTDINSGIRQASLTVTSTGGNIALGNIGTEANPVLSLTVNTSNLLTLKGNINTTNQVNVSGVSGIILDGAIVIRALGGFDVGTKAINGNQGNTASLTIYATTGPINLNSVGTTEALAFLRLSSGKLVAISGDIVVTDSVDFSGVNDISFIGDRTISTTAALAQVNLAVGTSISGDAKLSINNSGETFLGGTINMTGDLNLANAGTINVSKNLSINSDGTLSLAGNIISSGTATAIDMSGVNAIALLKDSSFNTSATNASLNFSGTGIQGPGALAINTGSGNVTLNTLGNTAALSALSITSSGLTRLEGNITTGKTGINLSNASNILLTNNITMATSDNGVIAIDGGAVNGTYNLILNTAGNGKITLGNMGQNVNNALSSLSVINSGETYFSNANIRTIGEGSINLSQAPQVYMTGNVYFESTANTGVVNLNGGNIDGDGSLTVVANEGAIELGTVGSKIPLAFLKLQANGLTKAYGQLTTLNDIDLSLATVSSGIEATPFDWALTSSNGNITLGDLSSGTLFGSITATSGNKVVLNGNLSTQGSGGISIKSLTPNTLAAKLVLGANVSINTSAGNGLIDLSNALLFGKDENASGNSFGLSLTSGEGNILLNSSDQNSALAYLQVNTLSNATTSGLLYVEQNIDYTTGSFTQDSLSNITSNFGNITVTANTGNILLGLLSAPNGTVTVKSLVGDILSNTSTPFIDAGSGLRSKSTSETINIIAKNAVLDSAGAFGASTIDPIIVAVDPSGTVDINFNRTRGYIDNLNGTVINNLSNNSLIDQLQIRSAIADTIAITNQKFNQGETAQSEFIMGETLFGILGASFYVAHASGTGSITARSLVPDVPALLQDTSGWKFERPRKKQRTIHKSRQKNETLINWF